MKKSFEDDLTPEIREKTKKNLVYVSIFSIVMLFAGLTSAYVVSMGDSFWLKTPLPSAFYISTALIFLSSILFILGINAVKKGNQKGLKLFVSLTFILGLGFVYFQFKGYGELVDNGVHASSKIIVNEGRYGDYFTLKYDGDFLTVDGNDYFVGANKATAEQKTAISQFAEKLLPASDSTKLNIEKEYGSTFILFYKDQPLTLLEGKLMLPDGKVLQSHDLYRLRYFAYHLKDGRGDFYAKGELGKDFHIYYKGKELSYNNRTLYLGDRKLDGYLMNSAMDAADSASGYLYIITFTHLLHIIVTLLFMIKTLRYSFTGRYTQSDNIGLRVTGIFWHFLGLLWLYLLLFLLFIH